MTRKNKKSSREASTKYCFSLRFWVVSCLTCCRKRVFEKKIRVVFLKLKRWMIMGMERAVMAHRKRGKAKFIGDKAKKKEGLGLSV